MYNNRLYTIKTLSNLHVGSGDVNYSVVDKQVQRDTITKMPIINSSSLKGALREFVKNSSIAKQHIANSEAPQAGDKLIYAIFGQKPKLEKGEKEKKKAGDVLFSEGKLLTIPVRTDKKAFMYATCPMLLETYKDICEIYGFTLPDIDKLEFGYFSESVEGELIAEEQDFRLNRQESLKKLQPLIGDDVIYLTDNEFKEIVTSLPIIARNHLENGESKNLFYEEVVPREAIFYMVLQFPYKVLVADSQVIEHYEKFQAILADTKIYLGANTSIGYGLCQVKQIEATNEPIEKKEEATYEPSNS